MQASCRVSSVPRYPWNLSRLLPGGFLGREIFMYFSRKFHSTYVDYLIIIISIVEYVFIRGDCVLFSTARHNSAVFNSQSFVSYS